jgi:hypothetical protein
MIGLQQPAEPEKVGLQRPFRIAGRGISPAGADQRVAAHPLVHIHQQHAERRRQSFALHPHRPIAPIDHQRPEIAVTGLSC